MPLLIDLRQALDALAGSPLAVVVLQRVDQLAHEARGEVDPRDDHAWDLLLLDLVIHAGERDAELVVGMRDVREVPVVPGHDLRGRLQVDVALLILVSHVTPSIAQARIVVLAVRRNRPPYSDDVAHYEKLLRRQAR